MKNYAVTLKIWKEENTEVEPDTTTYCRVVVGQLSVKVAGLGLSTCGRGGLRVLGHVRPDEVDDLDEVECDADTAVYEHEPACVCVCVCACV